MGLVVAEDRGDVVGEVLVHQVARPEDRQSLLARDHELEELLVLDRGVALEGDLLDFEVGAFLHGDRDGGGLGRFLDRVIHLRAVVPLALQVAALILDVLEDQVLVEVLPREQVVHVVADGLRLDADGLENDVRADGDPIHRHDASIVGGLRGDQLHGSLQARGLVQQRGHARGVGPRLRFPVTVARLHLRFLEQIVGAVGRGLAVEERARDAGGGARLDAVEDRHVEGLPVVGDFGIDLRLEIAVFLEAPLDGGRALDEQFGLEGRAFGKGDRAAQLFARQVRAAGEAQRKNAEGAKEVDGDGDAALGGHGLDLDVGEAAGREEVADRRASRGLGQRSAGADLDQPLDVPAVHRSVGGVRDRDDGEVEDGGLLGGEAARQEHGGSQHSDNEGDRREGASPSPTARGALDRSIRARLRSVPARWSQNRCRRRMSIR